MNLAIITLNYNSLENTTSQINALLNEGVSNDFFYVVDNDSNDKKELKKYCENKKIKFIQSLKNGGYAYGNNIAIHQAIIDNKDIFLLLNPDIKINRLCIEELYQTLIKDKSLGVIGPRLCQHYNHNLIVSDGGLLFPQKGFQGGHVNSDKNRTNFDFPYILNKDIDYVNGSALMFKKEVLEGVGFMREDFFMYYEESEWCYRIKKHGKWKMVIKTDSIAYQEDSSRGNFYQFYMTRNRIWICRLYKGNVNYILKEQLKIIKNSIFSRNKNYKLASTLLKAIYFGLIKKI